MEPFLARVFLLFLVVCQTGVDAQNRPRYFGSSSSHVCHCRYPQSCNTNTGHCSSGGCESGWMGPSCQYANIAVDARAYVGSSEKSALVDGWETSQCSDLNEGTNSIDLDLQQQTWTRWIRIFAAHLAGRLNTIDIALDQIPMECTDINLDNGILDIYCKEPKLTWQIEIRLGLKKRTRVCEVQISGGFEYRLDGFELRSRSDSDQGWELIQKHGTAAEVITIIPSKIKQARFINIRMPSCQVFSLCEVQIFADCPDNTFGFDCLGKCNCNDYDEMCDPVTGYCNSGCQPGFTGVSCDQECPRGTFGVSCGSTCTNCLNSICNHVNGSCLSGCAVGVKPDSYPVCNKACIDGTFGLRCNSACHCRLGEVCNKTTGTCPLGCAAGYTGNDCQQECQRGTYGFDCRERCSANCIQRSCNSKTGACACASGYKGRNCTEVCNVGFYGINCTESCNDKCVPNTGGWSKCDHRSGKCRDGCLPGWMSDKCDRGCPRGRYGANCVASCSTNCATSSVCDAETGKCKGGCRTGYRGDLCSQVCSSGFYGANCSQQCSDNCYTSRSCYRSTGNCKEGCKPGWKDGKCDQVCPDGKYGHQCARNCNQNCVEKMCHHVNGSCSKGCVPGKQGHGCQNDCDIHRYGQDCAETCSKGCHRQECYSDDGYCKFTGCTAGWVGPRCSEACPSGLYGEKCSRNCSTMCQDSLCHHVHGQCTRGCIAGFIGENCSQVCPEGRYGMKCELSCSDGCDGGVCNNTDGKCTCLEGRQGVLCDLGCDAGFYGSACQSLCSSRCDQSTCHGVSGQCMGCQSGWNGDFCDQADGMSTGAIAGVAIVAVAIILAGVLLAAFFIRKKGMNKDPSSRVRYDNSSLQESKRKIEIERKIVHTTASSSSQVPLVKDEDGHDSTVYYNIGPMSSSTVQFVDNFSEYIRKARQNKQRLYDEFAKLPKDLTHEHNVAFSPANMKKNRYKNICAYDHSRVVLPVSADDPEGSDYINACYINTPRKEKGFIASQGPNTAILDDFIRMLWDLEIKKVVMLTNLVEEGKQKCHPYWCDEGESVFGDITILVKEIQLYADYTVRKLRLTKEGKKCRFVFQFHYTAWPDKGVPRSPCSLIDFRDKVMSFKTGNQNPVVVHCSAGIGRTGTLIALQNLKEEAERNQTQDVYTCVWNLRQQRVNMVQTKDQYVFIHEAALLSLIASENTVSAEQFQVDRSKINDAAALKREFKILQECPVSVDEDEFSVAKEQQSKNRDSNILAGDSYRPVLSLDADNPQMSSTYINAVFLPGCKSSRRYIQTQTPLKTTVFDFWRLIADYNVEKIVMLDSYTHTNQDAAVYWPEVHAPLNLDSFTVVCSCVYQNNQVQVREMELKQGDSSRTVVQYSARFWPKTGLPSAVSLLHLLRLTELNQRQQDNPVVVHCRSGSERSGLFCCLAAILERVGLDNNVAIPIIVGNFKVIRSQNIPTLDQYRLCYQAVLEELTSDPVYSNTEGEAPVTSGQEENVYSNMGGEHEALYYNQ